MQRLAPTESEGSYLESLSDLFVGFVFIFIIFLMLFALLLAQAQKRVEVATTKLMDAGALRSQMLQEIEDALKRRGIQIKIDTRTGIARLPESLLFDSGSATLKPGGQRRLAIVAHELRAIIPCYAYGVGPITHCSTSARPVLDAMFIEGHTDNVVFRGGSVDNYDLSAERAKQTFQALKKGAPDLDRLKNEAGQRLLSISAYGPDRPLASNASDSGRRSNRRIDLRFIVGTPNSEDIQRARSTGILR